MRILALDTSTEYCSVALRVDENCVERSELAGQRHSELLLPMIRAVLDQAGVAMHTLDGCAVGIGPGSFTGLRIGCGVGQGLAFAAKLPVIGVCSLEAIAETQRARSGSRRVLAALDARMQEVYVAAYEHDGHVWKTVLAPTVLPPDAVSVPQTDEDSNGSDAQVTVKRASASTGQRERWHAAGPGFAAYPGLLERLADHIETWDVGTLPSAAAIARLGATSFSQGLGVDARDLAPLYVRHRVALTTAEREAGARL
jgi:tRNA threonylcarbamoyladenosine biosynthesis protein TsaB